MTIETPSEQLQQQLRAWAERTLGPITTLDDRSRAVGQQSLVWRLETDDGHNYYLKRHEARSLYERELSALRDWLPTLPEAARQMTVPMIASADHLDAMLFEAAPGEIVEEADLTTEELHAAHRMAGEFAASLHALPCQDRGPASDYTSDLLRKIERLFELYQGVEGIDEGLRRFLIDAVTIGDPFSDVELVPTHMDYSPRNWLLHRGAGALRLHVIDWERARLDIWTQDAQWMVDQHWHRDPTLREAFFLGYGRQPSELEQRRLRLLSLVQTVPSIGWAHARSDGPFEARAREVLCRLRSELGS